MRVGKSPLTFSIWASWSIHIHIHWINNNKIAETSNWVAYNPTLPIFVMEGKRVLWCYDHWSRSEWRDQIMVKVWDCREEDIWQDIACIREGWGFDGYSWLWFDGLVPQFQSLSFASLFSVSLTLTQCSRN